MEKAVFSMKEYRFTKVAMDFSEPLQGSLELEIHPRGEHYLEDKEYVLYFDFLAKSEAKAVFRVTCRAVFELTSDGLPEFFYANSIAIIFPYVRAFISTVSLQANVPSIVLPTMNLSSLRETLAQSTVIYTSRGDNERSNPLPGC